MSAKIPNDEIKTVSLKQTFLKTVQNNVLVFNKERPKIIEQFQTLCIKAIKQEILHISKQGETNYDYYMQDLQKTEENNRKLQLRDTERKAVLKSIMQYFELEGFQCSHNRYSNNYSGGKSGENINIDWA